MKIAPNEKPLLFNFILFFKDFESNTSLLGTIVKGCNKKQRYGKDIITRG